MKEFAIILLIRVPRMAPPATKQDRLTMSALYGINGADGDKAVEEVVDFLSV